MAEENNVHAGRKGLDLSSSICSGSSGVACATQALDDINFLKWSTLKVMKVYSTALPFYCLSTVILTAQCFFLIVNFEMHKLVQMCVSFLPLLVFYYQSLVLKTKGIQTFSR